MATYQIENRTSGVILGTFDAGSPAEALDKMAQDAGYADYAAIASALCLANEAPAHDDDIIVVDLIAATLAELTDRYTTLPAGWQKAVKNANTETIQRVHDRACEDASGEDIASALGFSDDETND